MGGRYFNLINAFLPNIPLNLSVNRLTLAFAFLIALCLFPQIHYAHALNVNQNSSSPIITVSDPALQTQVVSLDLCDSLRHLYIRTNYSILYFKQHNIKTVRVGLKDRSNIFRWIKYDP